MGLPDVGRGWMRNSIPETGGGQGESCSFCPLCSLFADAKNETTAATPFLRAAQPRSSEDRRESCPLPQPPCHELGGTLPTPARVLLWLPPPAPPQFCPAPGALPPAVAHLGCYRDPAGQVRPVGSTIGIGLAKARLGLTQLADVAINSQGELEIAVGGGSWWEGARVLAPGPEEKGRAPEAEKENKAPFSSAPPPPAAANGVFAPGNIWGSSVKSRTLEVRPEWWGRDAGGSGGEGQV